MPDGTVTRRVRSRKPDSAAPALIGARRHRPPAVADRGRSMIEVVVAVAVVPADRLAIAGRTKTTRRRAFHTTAPRVRVPGCVCYDAGLREPSRGLSVVGDHDVKLEGLSPQDPPGFDPRIVFQANDDMNPARIQSSVDVDE